MSLSICVCLFVWQKPEARKKRLPKYFRRCHLSSLRLSRPPHFQWRHPRRPIMHLSHSSRQEEDCFVILFSSLIMSLWISSVSPPHLHVMFSVLFSFLQSWACQSGCFPFSLSLYINTDLPINLSIVSYSAASRNFTECGGLFFCVFFK